MLCPQRAEVGRTWQLVAAAEINNSQGSWIKEVRLVQL